ncbi:MFS transporter [Longispora fulva]|uniref:MFS family permease n=1 Tax=Longispora fulva TaxID=619741 RepID=A0A8J7G734_9ACTN|nr:MFS transporter [Longispora fulva]MBG6134180.1 MFS family permease [Longispora fulva]
MVVRFVSSIVGTFATWRRLPRAVWLLTAARAVNRLGAFTLAFLTIAVTARGFTVADAGLLMSAFGLAAIVSRLIGGRLADRIGRRATIVGGLVATAAAQLALAASTSRLALAVAVIAVGLAFEIYEPASQSLIGDVTEPADRPVAYGLFGAALACAGIAAGALATLLGGLDVRWLFVADAVTCLLCAVLIAATLPGTTRTTPPTRGTAPTGRNPWRDPLLRAFLATGTVFAVLYMQLLTTLPLTLARHHLGAGAFGLLLTLSAITIVAGQPLLAAPFTSMTAMTAGYVLLGAGLALNAAAANLATFIAATVVWSTGEVLLLGHVYALVGDLAPATARAHYLSVYGISWGIATLVGPFAGTQALAHAGQAWLWTAAGACSLALAAIQPRLHRKARQRTDAHQPAPVSASLEILS